jgi:CheY-like chemotaxis protein
LASLGELAAGIGHEINNPLAIAIGNLELCRREFLKGDINLEHINKSIDKQNIALNRIKKIVDSLRVYTRSDNNIVEDFSLKDIVGEVFYLLEEIYLKEGVTLIFDSPRNDFTISGVPGEFQQVILNLIKNAKDSIKGRDRQEIILTVHRRPLDQLTISVADTGSGIPEEIRDKIFNPFFTSKPVGEGTGLGLGICHDIIERMGGKLYFDTIMDEGTTFSIDLPCRPENRANSSVLKQGPERKSRDLNNASEIPEGAELKGLRILLVEDEEFLLEATKIQIEDYGAEVFTAKCGATALDVFNEHEVDVILCDYMMPNLKGDQFYYKVEDRIRSKIPFFLITGGISNPSANVEKFLEAIDGVIEKPVSMPSLIEKLKEVKENLPG